MDAVFKIELDKTEEALAKVRTLQNAPALSISGERAIEHLNETIAHATTAREILHCERDHER
jgi:hypothetical protein